MSFTEIEDKLETEGNKEKLCYMEGAKNVRGILQGMIDKSEKDYEIDRLAHIATGENENAFLTSRYTYQILDLLSDYVKSSSDFVRWLNNRD